MSNFLCPECGERIIEDYYGFYITSCPHYPMMDKERERLRKLEELFKPKEDEECSQ